MLRALRKLSKLYEHAVVGKEDNAIVCPRAAISDFTNIGTSWKITLRRQ